MPELPEVEHLRRSLEPDLVGALVERAFLLRDDIVRRVPGDAHVHPSRMLAQLLEGSTIATLERRGKQLALRTDRGRGMVVQLGMTGQLRWGADPHEPDPHLLAAVDHVHARWVVRDPFGRRRMLEFRDPRRFGGLSPFESEKDRAERLWPSLGPDAIDEPAEGLVERLMSFAKDSRRPLKSLLLDQSVVAGLGNIYADEALFAANLHPLLPSKRLTATAGFRLVQEFRLILHRAIEAGGSTLRDYVDARGQPGSFQETHQVYGRGGLDCLRCSASLRSGLIAGRTTVWCPRCQGRSSRAKKTPTRAQDA